MKKRIIHFFISCIILICTVTTICVIYIHSTKIEYPWYFEKLRITNNQEYKSMDEIGIAIVDSGFNDNCQKYFENDIIEYDETGEENNSDLTGHGTQMALLIGSNSNQKNSFYGINSNLQN